MQGRGDREDAIDFVSKRSPERRLTRRGFIAVSGGAGAALFVGACGGGSDAESKFGSGDVGVLSYALWLEGAQVGLYSSAAASGQFTAAEATIMREFEADERAHALALAKAVRKLGGTAEATRFKFPSGSRETLLGQLATLESMAAATYLGQLPEVDNEEALDTLASIHTVEGSHSATIDEMRGGSATPQGAFAKPLAIDVAVERFEPFVIG